MRRDIEAATTGTTTQFLRATTRNSQTAVHGDRATVTEDVALLFTFDQRQAGGVLFNETDAQPWTFELVNDGGWRVCSVAAPQICTEVLDCDRSTPTPSGRPSSSPTDDLLSRPREMLDGERRPCLGMAAASLCPSTPESHRSGRPAGRRPSRTTPGGSGRPQRTLRRPGENRSKRDRHSRAIFLRSRR